MPLRLLLLTNAWPPPGPTVKRNAEALQAAGLNVEVFAFRGRGPYNYLAAWTRLRPRLHRGRYDVVHAQDTIQAWLAFPKRVPLVLSVGGMRWGARFLARRADAVVVPSEQLGRQLATRKRGVVIPADTSEQARTTRLLEVYRSVQPAPAPSR